MLNDIVKNLVLPILKVTCPGRVCPLSVFEHFLKQFSPGFDFAEAGKRNAADFKGLLDEYMGYVLRQGRRGNCKTREATCHCHHH